MSKQIRKGLSSPCKLCRRRVKPELLDGSFLCWRCRNDPAAKWLGSVDRARKAGFPRGGGLGKRPKPEQP